MMQTLQRLTHHLSLTQYWMSRRIYPFTLQGNVDQGTHNLFTTEAAIDPPVSEKFVRIQRRWN
ncbi:MAG: hypothetical protein CMI18_05945 [Opitutaceae bacterium]|nr:hypothetical protein [Opitutaceae bacterium]